MRTLGFSFNKLFSARWDDALDGLVEILGEEPLAVKPIGNVVKHLYVLGKHVQDRLEVALIEGTGELLCQD
jgi:hypothetical protein